MTPQSPPRGDVNPYEPPKPTPDQTFVTRWMGMIPLLGFFLGLSGVVGVIVGLLIFRYFGVTLNEISR